MINEIQPKIKFQNIVLCPFKLWCTFIPILSAVSRVIWFVSIFTEESDSEESEVENSAEEDTPLSSFCTRSRSNPSPLTPSNQANQDLVDLIAEKKCLSKCDAQLLVAEGYQLREAKIVLTPQKVHPEDSVKVDPAVLKARDGKMRTRFVKKLDSANGHIEDTVKMEGTAGKQEDKIRTRFCKKLDSVNGHLAEDGVGPADQTLAIKTESDVTDRRRRTSSTDVDRCRTRLCARLNSTNSEDADSSGMNGGTVSKESSATVEKKERISLFDTLQAMKTGMSPERTCEEARTQKPNSELKIATDADTGRTVNPISLRRRSGDENRGRAHLLIKVLQSSTNDYRVAMSDSQTDTPAVSSDQLSSCSSDSEVTFKVKPVPAQPKTNRPVTRCSQSFTYESELSDCETKLKIRGIRKMKFYGDKGGSPDVVTSSRTGKFVRNGSADVNEASSVEKLAAKRKLTKYDAQLIKEAKKKIPKLKIRIGDEIVTSSEDEVSPRNRKRTKSELCSDDSMDSPPPRPVTRGKKIPTPGARPGSKPHKEPKRNQVVSDQLDTTTQDSQRPRNMSHQFVPRMSQLKQLYEIPPHPMCKQMKVKPHLSPPTPPESENGSCDTPSPRADKVFGSQVTSPLSFNGIAMAAQSGSSRSAPATSGDSSDNNTRKVRFIFGEDNTLDLQVPKTTSPRLNRKRTKSMCSYL